MDKLQFLVLIVNRGLPTKTDIDVVTYPKFVWIGSDYVTSQIQWHFGPS